MLEGGIKILDGSRVRPGDDACGRDVTVTETIWWQTGILYSKIHTQNFKVVLESRSLIESLYIHEKQTPE
jgi:hypothetical protein